jgi:hypothetical protein
MKKSNTGEKKPKLEDSPITPIKTVDEIHEKVKSD